MLRKEKSLLIKDVNHKISKSDFYNQIIPEYKIFATVQALLNEWRGASRLSPSEVVSYETFLENHLTREDSSETLKKSETANPLVLKLMTNKFNKKYNTYLTKEQKKLLESKLSGNTEEVIMQVKQTKERAIRAIKSFYSTCDNGVILSKQTMVENSINDFAPDGSDKSIAKALLLSSLLQELEVKDV